MLTLEQLVEEFRKLGVEEGNTLLVNGRKHPRIVMRSGVTERWRVINAAKSRFFDLDPGADKSFTKIGDDSGLQEYPEQLDSLVLAPGERADVLYTPTARPGTEYAIHARLFNRGYGSVEARVGEDILDIAMADSPPMPISLSIFEIRASMRSSLSCRSAASSIC